MNQLQSRYWNGILEETEGGEGQYKHEEGLNKLKRNKNVVGCQKDGTK